MTIIVGILPSTLCRIFLVYYDCVCYILRATYILYVVICSYFHELRTCVVTSSEMWTSVGSISALTGHIFTSYEHVFPSNEYVDQCGIDLSTDGPYFHELQTCVPE